MLKQAALLALGLLLSPAASVVSQELKKISLGYPSLAFTQSHIWVAKEEGLFKKHGLDVDPVFLRGGQVATQVLAAGEPPISQRRHGDSSQPVRLQPGARRH